MGIVSSTFTSLAIQIAWTCQRLLDPRYRCVETKKEPELSPPPKTAEVTEQAKVIVNAPITVVQFDNSSNAHQENRNRRARQLRFRNRPSSFDASLIVSERTKSYPSGTIHTTRLVTSMSSPPQARQARFWDMTSSSGCSSDSGSYLDSDSDAEIPPQETQSEEPTDAEARKEFSLSAAEEAAFRLTVGRGHFSRSKKDKFLNHLRLEKRLNDMNKEFFEVACLTHCRTLQRRHSGDLHRIV